MKVVVALLCLVALASAQYTIRLPTNIDTLINDAKGLRETCFPGNNICHSPPFRTRAMDENVLATVISSIAQQILNYLGVSNLRTNDSLIKGVFDIVSWIVTAVAEVI
ncbi:uncharacterized protein LOC118510817 [Anopheles stephensi]|uniref:uncharacterized protein LOC118510817 n=1 Tax=Anopheles stephensi TaxID=30069 RepID=UPI0007D452BE|nr:uncharacterized protein LOC118510817 [Anopheles stephensi]